MTINDLALTQHNFDAIAHTHGSQMFARALSEIQRLRSELALAEQRGLEKGIEECSLCVDQVVKDALVRHGAKIWNEVVEKCATLHADINPASDEERLHHVPGAGAMAVVLEYRDAIRRLVLASPDTKSKGG